MLRLSNKGKQKYMTKLSKSGLEWKGGAVMAMQGPKELISSLSCSACVPGLRFLRGLKGSVLVGHGIGSWEIRKG